MEHRTDELTRARGRMASDIRTVIADGEDLLKAAAQASGAGLAVARERIDETLHSAGARLADASRPVVDQARKTAAAADGYVHSHPWTVIGAAAAVGTLIGVLVARR
jgi:ElaB/YqjD/DUF883 family membrane-anchored ribosome-binding protein